MGKGTDSSFFRELRRRNVFKVTMVYLIASWLLIQIAETTFPALKLPEWTVTFVVVILAMLLPIAVIFAWAFELTPEGLRRTGQVAPDESIASHTGQRMNRLIIGALAIAVVFLVSTHGGLRLGTEDEKEGQRRETSIAVLPFVNMSGDSENEFFSDGLSEELLNVLAQVDGLRVAARTSSFHFKGSQEDLRDIASKLSVEHVLEGSVRKSGNRIRATAQLIKADDGFHLWSDTYEYEIDDIFRIQDEIALSVVDALKVNLLGEERQRLTKRATTSVEAHNLYLRGRQFLHLRTLESLQQARELFQRSVTMDPDFALAYSGLSDSINLLFTNHAMMSRKAAVGESRPLLERAVALDAKSAEIWASIGLMEMNDQNPEAAKAALERSIELNPSYAAGYLWYASVKSGSPYHDVEGALAIYRKVLEIDPLSRVGQQNVGAMLQTLGRYDEAEREFRRAITLDPDYTAPYSGVANIAQNIRYRLDEAHRWYLKAYSLAPLDIGTGVNLPALYLQLQMPDEFDRWTRRLHNEAPKHPIGSVIPIWRAIAAADVVEARRTLAETEREGFAIKIILRQVDCVLSQAEGVPERSLGALESANPELFSTPVRVNDSNNQLVVCAVWGLRAAGREDQMLELADAWRQWADVGIGFSTNRLRATADLESALGNYDAAAAALAEAVDAGWVGGFAWGGPMENDPVWAPLVDRADVRAINDRLNEKIAVQRAAVIGQLESEGIGLKF